MSASGRGRLVSQRMHYTVLPAQVGGAPTSPALGDAHFPSWGDFALLTHCSLLPPSIRWLELAAFLGSVRGAFHDAWARVIGLGWDRHGVGRQRQGDGGGLGGSSSRGGHTHLVLHAIGRTSGHHGRVLGRAFAWHLGGRTTTKRYRPRLTSHQQWGQTAPYLSPHILSTWTPLSWHFWDQGRR